MDKMTFMDAVATLLAHEKRLRALNDYLRKEDQENGDGLFQCLPSTDIKIRRLAIDLLALACGVVVKNSVVEYFLDECQGLRGGGKITYPDGTKFELVTTEDLWTVVCYERIQNPPQQ